MKMLANLSSELANRLEDIVNKIEIGANFYLSHQDYSASENAPEIVESLQKLPLDFQEQYLAEQLQDYLADIYFHGYDLRKNSEVDEISFPLENNTIYGVNRDFYQLLEANNHGTGYFDPGWLVIREEEDGSLAVQKHDLTFHIERDRHLPAQDSQATVNDLVSIWLPHNRWQEDCYVAVSNNGLVEFSKANREQIIEIYFNIAPEAAIILLKELTRQFNDLKLTFTLKILDDPNDYPCYDAVILAIFRDDYLIVKEVIKSLYPEIQPHLHHETPLCTLKLAPGIGLAEATEDNFANSRCGAIAKGLLSAWYEGDNSPQNRLQCIQEEFTLQGINWHYSYLKGNFGHIYQPLI